VIPVTVNAFWLTAWEKAELVLPFHVVLPDVAPL
jgi:hypothetical protein